MKKNGYKYFLLILAFLLSGCASIEKAGINMISDVMAGEGSSELFTGDDDPELIKDALPFIMKMYEMLAGENPDDPDLLLATGSVFIMYSNVFIQTEADMLPDDEFERQFEMLARSKKMYRRGTDYLLRALELRHEGFLKLFEEGLMDEALAEMTAEDVPLLYWTASGLMGEFSVDPFDFSLGPVIYKSVACVYKALELDESFNNGAIHDLLIQITASLPGPMMFKAGGEEPSATELFVRNYYDSMGIEAPFDMARYHFERSNEISGGVNAGTYIALASTVCVLEQNLAEFEELLETAVEIDPDEFPEMRLAGIIYRNKAQWLLDHKSDYFLIDFDEGEFDEIF